MLEIESKSWWTRENIDKLEENMLIPELIYDETDYYIRLHEAVLLMTEGDFDAMEELYSENN